MSKKIKTKHSVLILSLSLLLIISAISVFAGVTFAKYLKEEAISSGATVASFSFQLGDLSSDNLEAGQEEETITLQNINYGSSIQYYTFEVSNGNNTKISSVAIQYDLSIKTTGNLPLIINLKNSLGDSLATINQTTKTASYLTPTGLLANQLITNAYTISVEWDSNFSSPLFAGVMDIITITTNWEQID